jgi:hypothetical protein
LEILYLAWFSLGLIGVVDVLARRRHPEPLPEGPPPAAPARALAWLAGLAAVLALARIPLAVGRGGRGVDEVQYAATAWYVEVSGRSLFDWAWNLHGHQLLYALGSPQDPFTAVDVVTSLVVGATAFLLGWTVLRIGRDPRVALLTCAFFALGLIRYEGLSSNKEPYVDLFLAAWLLLRVGLQGAGRPRLRRLAAGACLGAAVVMKEQAILFVLAEPALAVLELLDARRGGGAPAPPASAPNAETAAAAGTTSASADAAPPEVPWRPAALGLALAAAGFALPVLLLLAGFVAHGQGAAYIAFLVDWGSSGGAPMGSFSLPPAPPGPDDPGALPRVLDGLFPLWVSPVCMLGTLELIRLLGEARQLPRRPLARALVPLALIGLVAISVGMRWTLHYWMLLLPALAPLAARRLISDAPLVRRPGPRRLVAATAVGLFALLACVEAKYLLGPVGRLDARGGGLAGPEARAAELVGGWVRARTSPKARILVWGWRPELYLLAERAPFHAYVGGVTASKDDLLASLASDPPPALILKPPPAGWYADPDGEHPDAFGLERHPELVRILRERGFRLVAGPPQLAGWAAWAPPQRTQ